MRRDFVFDPWTIALGLFALSNAANAVWMLADPAGWYTQLPGQVPDFGPLNTHFVRDIGATFMMIAVGLGVAAVRPALRFPVLALVSVFFLLHALVHVGETAAGVVAAQHWLLDTPGVYLPAVLMLGLTAALARTRKARA